MSGGVGGLSRMIDCHSGGGSTEKDWWKRGEKGDKGNDRRSAVVKYLDPRYGAILWGKRMSYEGVAVESRRVS
jgi:hypothetical protein